MTTGRGSGSSQRSTAGLAADGVQQAGPPSTIRPRIPGALCGGARATPRPPTPSPPSLRTWSSRERRLPRRSKRSQERDHRGDFGVSDPPSLGLRRSRPTRVSALPRQRQLHDRERASWCPRTSSMAGETKACFAWTRNRCTPSVGRPAERQTRQAEPEGDFGSTGRKWAASATETDVG